MIQVSPSILSADFLSFKEDLKVFEKSGVDMLHVDVMDGNFVPNISFGVPVIKSIKKYTNIPLDVHLMIDKPHRYIDEFAEVSDWLSFHFEAGSDNKDLLCKIREKGCKSCIAIKPATSAEEVFGLLPFCDMVLVMSVEPGFGGQKFMPMALEKLEKLKAEIDKRGLDIRLEVDGGINAETAPLVVKSGADVLVAGSYVLSADNMEERINYLKSL